MKEGSITIGLAALPVFFLNTVVVGTGAAGYNAADRLFDYGQSDIAIVTENVLAGTSRNAGSDKQTYYKLTLSGSEPDSVRDMAETLFSGQCVDGDTALCEAALSAQCFFRLAESGVPFPQNRYGGFIGYKTDHDPRCRGSSAGPYTSRKMTECLQAAVEKKGIRIFNRMQVVSILGDGRQVFGLLCLDLEKAGKTWGPFVLFSCRNIIYAVGGPAGMYADSVYPYGQYGSSGLAFEAGAKGKNLTEWQYGLASLRPRWNVSGTYMQALPRVFSTNGQGKDEREFLSGYFQDKGKMLTNLFLKGYQWPFDISKVSGGSSIIDILVYNERTNGRRVYLDYSRNTGNEEIDFQSLSNEAHAYLSSAGACFGTPIQRLSHMNSPAAGFYLDNGIDLSKDRLEIALCAQHNNGGLSIDNWWQTNLEGFFAVGEVSASHGVYRPGGSALNAGQVGGMRAARYISEHRKGEAPDSETFRNLVAAQVGGMLELAETLRSGEDNVKAHWDKANHRMSRIGGPVRSMDGLTRGLAQTRRELAEFAQTVRVRHSNGLGMALRLRDMLISQEVYLSAMADYLENGGKSRSSALYSDPEGTKPHVRLPDRFAYTLDDGSRGKMVQEVCRHKDGNEFYWRDVRPIPEEDDCFENVWREFREHGNVY